MGEFYLFYNFGHFSKVFPLKKFFVVVDVNLTFALKPGALFPISIFCPKFNFVWIFWTQIERKFNFMILFEEHLPILMENSEMSKLNFLDKN